MAKVEGLRSGYAKVGDLVYFGRMLDKIRLSQQGLLPSGYNLGDQNPLFFDGVCCRFLQVEYRGIIDQVGTGRSDEEILEWAYQAGRRPPQDEIRCWNSFMTKCGWRDKSTASLNRWKNYSDWRIVRMYTPSLIYTMRMKAGRFQTPANDELRREALERL
jgi:Domain of unknown function (DUF5069)